VKKKLLTLTVVLFTFCTFSIASAELVKKNTQSDTNTTDQFTPYQGDQPDLQDNNCIKENVKNRIRELADTKPETKDGTVIQKNLRPSVNQEKK
jgi:hypothetical protein